MKVVQVLGGNEDGGLENHTLSLSGALAATEEVHLIAHPVFQDRAHPEVRFHVLEMTRSRRDPRLLLSLLKRLRTLQPDLIHAQGGKAMALVGALSPWLKGTRITTVHNTGKSLKHLQRFHGVIGVSKAITATLPHPRAVTIYNGVALPSRSSRVELNSARKLWPVGDEGLRWLAVGRLVAAKGFDTLIDAFSEVSGTLLIAGEGPERETLEQRIQARELDARVRLLGHRTDAGLLMDACDALVISSRREGFSYVFAEALLRQCPIVSTDVPVANEVLPPELLCPIDSPIALARLMRELDPESPQQLQAREIAESLALDTMVANTLRFYRQLLDADHD